MLSESEILVWEVFGTSDEGHLNRDARTQLRLCLDQAEAPLRWTVLVASLVAYAGPLLFVQDSLLETLHEADIERAWLVVAVLFAASTLVLSPLFGLLTQSRRDSKALLDSGRKFPALSVRSTNDRWTLLIATREGAREVHVPAVGAAAPTDCMVYAVPEEANLTVVEWSAAHGIERRVGRLFTS